MLDTPGVYVQEIPSGSAPIAGVATSNTAFIGVLGRGPVGRATRVTSWGEFERVFGGLHAGCETSYALRNYYLNGGNIAFVVRVNNGAVAASVALPPNAGGISLTASSPGVWGNSLRVGIARASGAGVTTFDLLLREYRGTELLREETFAALSITAGHPRYVTRVLAAESQLAIVSAHTAGNLPDATQAGGSGVTTLEALRLLGAAALTALSGGTDGTLPADSDAFGTLTGTAHVPAINALDAIVPDVFNLMCLPDMAVLGQTRLAAAAAVYQAANTYCERNFAFLIVDCPAATTRANIGAWTTALGGAVRRNAALYYPRLTGPDPMNPVQNREMAASGAVAGIFARTDAARGVWKAPAGTAAGVSGGRPVDLMTDPQQGPLNVQGINAIRTFPVYNTVIWGTRTLDGADALASEWKYIPVRRLALHIENSLLRGLQWVVFEPNDEPLWASVRLNVTGFMSQLHRQGAFQGAAARDAFLVKCDSETTTQADINLGILNILVGFAPVRPAEFVVLRIQQRLQTNS
ncbi:phage tail sheath family protein [Paracoccus sp. (in: a-proteobacteria)]|uniref:phage tail sheath family protein n=1 Tax=Paracoccus sp. TaxID=267 RepID=UPI0035B167D2